MKIYKNFVYYDRYFGKYRICESVCVLEENGNLFVVLSLTNNFFPIGDEKYDFHTGRPLFWENQGAEIKNSKDLILTEFA